MRFTPRQIQILCLLAADQEGMTTEELAAQMHISKRTLFRELQDIDKPLDEYQLSIRNQPKRGIMLIGDEENKKRLLVVLKRMESFNPRDKGQRQKKLIALIIQHPEIQKLFHYSDILQVSEGTVSNDLDELKPWFVSFNVKLIRRSGLGVGLQYDEENYRKMMLGFIEQYHDHSLLDLQRMEIIKGTISVWPDSIINEFTFESINSIIYYLTIAVDRIKKKKKLPLQLQENIASEKEDINNLVENVSGSIEKLFEIEFNAAERTSFYIFLISRKWQSSKKLEEYVEELGQSIHLKELVFEMINAFDRENAFDLKQDEMFIEGLITHLRPTVIRLVYRMKIENPLLNEIKTNYSEIFIKVLQTVHVLEEMIRCPIPEEEIGLLALHFGAAVFRIKERMKKRRRVYVAVVCSSGIGISNLISSRLILHFEDRIKIKNLTTAEAEDIEEADFDFVISTFELRELPIPVIQVSVMLKQNDFSVLESMVNRYSLQKRRRSKTEAVDSGLKEILQLTKEIESIIEAFGIYCIDHRSEFDEVLKKIGMTLGKTEEKCGIIIEEIKARERLSTQVIPEYKMTFLHCKTNAVKNSKFIIIIPDQEAFTESYFKETEIIIVMLINNYNTTDLPAISSISQAIFENADFIDLIKSRDEELVKKEVVKVLNDFLHDNYKAIYD